MSKLTINGQTYDAEKGKSIIQVADEVGIEIPRYCYHLDIGIEGSCRMCLVEVKGVPKLMPASKITLFNVTPETVSRFKRSQKNSFTSDTTSRYTGFCCMVCGVPCMCITT